MLSMNLNTAEGVNADIQDESGKYGMDESIGSCEGNVETTSAGSVIAEVFPDLKFCPHCVLECSARMGL